MLTPSETHWLKWLAAQAVPEADILLRTHAGAGLESIAEVVRRPVGEIQSLQARFEQERWRALPRPRLSLSQLVTIAQPDPAHLDYVTARALELFERTQSLHRLPAIWSRRLKQAVQLLLCAQAIDPAQPVEAVRPIRLSGLSGRAASMAAILELPADASQMPQDRAWLILAALLHLAQAMDADRTQTTRIRGLTVAPHALHLRLAGAEAARAAAQAGQAAGLWQAAFHLTLKVRAVSPAAGGAPSQPASGPATSPRPPVSARPGLTLGRAAAHYLAVEWERWLEREADALAGDPAALAELKRVAEAWLAVLKELRHHLRPGLVQRIRRLLGVGRQRLRCAANWEARLELLPVEADDDGLRTLRQAWSRERDQARRSAQAWLGGVPGERLHRGVPRLLQSLSRQIDLELAEAGPGLLAKAAQRVETRAEALEPGQPGPVRRLRRALRRLRALLALLAPALGEEAGPALAEAQLQLDQLGRLAHAQQTRQRLEAFLDTWVEQQARRGAPQLHGAQGVLKLMRQLGQTHSSHARRAERLFAPTARHRQQRRLSRLGRALAGPARSHQP